MRRSKLESQFLKNRTIKNKAKYKKQNNFCSKLYKNEWRKFYSNLELNQITDNKRFWKTIKHLVSDKCIHSSAITLINNENVISDDFKLVQTFNNYFKSAVGKLGIKECEVSSDANANSRSKDGVDVAIEKYKDHPSIKMTKKNISFKSRFSFKEIRESDIQKEVSNLNFNKVRTFENVPTKVLKDSFDICNSVLQDIWKYEILGKQYFPKNLKLTDITPVYQKKDATSIENYRPVSVLPCASKVFERIIPKQFSSFVDDFLSPYLCSYRKGFNTQYAFLSLIEKWKETLHGKGILWQC